MTIVVVARQLDDEVRRLPAAVLGRRRLFLDEVAVLDHAGQLDDAPELDFAPFAAGVGRAQRSRQAVGGLAELLLRIAKSAELRRDCAVRTFARLVHFASCVWTARASRAPAEQGSACCRKSGRFSLSASCESDAERFAQLDLRLRQQRALFVERAARPPRAPRASLAASAASRICRIRKTIATSGRARPARPTAAAIQAGHALRLYASV